MACNPVARNPEEICNGMVEFFGDNLANPDREPKRFEWQMKLYKYLNRPQAKQNSQKE